MLFVIYKELQKTKEIEPPKQSSKSNEPPSNQQLAKINTQRSQAWGISIQLNFSIIPWNTKVIQIVWSF